MITQSDQSPNKGDVDTSIRGEKLSPSSAIPKTPSVNSASTHNRQRFRGFRLTALVIASLAGLVLAECAVRLLNLMPLQREAASVGNRDLAGAIENDGVSRLIIHPYRGFTPRPGIETAETARWISRSNLFGIRSMVTDPRTIGKEELVVGIFGGSVARGISFRGRQAVRQAILEVCPRFRDTLRIVNFAVSGYKQPQQLYLLSELLLLGVPIDIVVNIDGFNEIALGTTDADRGHHPLYPEHNFWLSTLEFAGGSLSSRQIDLTAQTIRLHRKAMNRRIALSHLPLLRHSALIQAAVGSAALGAERKAVALEELLRNEPRADRNQAVFNLPDPCPNGDSECQRLVADLWRRSSEQMRAVAEDSGASYIHILQPNQYVEDSKPLNAEELATAWAPQRPWSRAAASGYTVLRISGEELASNGVDFHDLSMVFQGHQETIYNDVCCHFNERGYEIFGRKVGKLIGQDLAEHDARERIFR